MMISSEVKKNIEAWLDNPYKNNLPNGFSNDFLEVPALKIQDHIVNLNFIAGNHIVNKENWSMQRARERQEPISRHWERFVHSFNSPATERLYIMEVEKFLQRWSINHIQLVEMDEESRQWLLEKYVMEQVSMKYRKTGIRTRLAAIEKFLDLNRVVYYKKPLHALVKDNGCEEIGGRVPYTNDEIRMMIEYSKSLRTIALILFFASTAIRPGALVDPPLRVKHLFKVGFGCYAVRIYDKSESGFSECSKFGYWTFLTPEASNALDKYLESRSVNGEKITKESPLFRSSSKTHDHITVTDVYRIFKELFQHVDIKRRKVENTRWGRYDKAITYAFRKKANTEFGMSGIKHEIVERMMGRSDKLDNTYVRPTKEQLFEKFKPFIPELTIGIAEKIKLELETKNMELDKLAQTEMRNKELETKVEKLERALVEKTLGETRNDIISNFSHKNLDHVHLIE